MTQQYMMKAGTWWWWSVAVFYIILDLACINAYVFYKKTKDAISRRNFMFQVATELRETLVQENTAPLAAVFFHFSTIFIKI